LPEIEACNLEVDFIYGVKKNREGLLGPGEPTWFWREIFTPGGEWVQATESVAKELTNSAISHNRGLIEKYLSSH